MDGLINRLFRINERGLGLAALLVLLVGPSVSAREVPNFNLLDIHDKNHELYRAKGKAVVLFFTGTGCPIARKSVGKIKALKESYQRQGVDFWIINSYANESMKAIRKEINQLGLKEMTYLRDFNQLVAYSYGVNRTAEVIALDAFSWEIFYRGAVDDQLSEGAEKPTASKQYLKDALEQFMAGDTVAMAKTRSVGCRIAYAKVGGTPEAPDYATQVAPILRENCVGCHRPGGIGPWSMSSHRRVSQYADMIEEVLLTRRMPPWDPHPDYGEFSNEQVLTREESQTLLHWIKAGSPMSDGEDPLEAPLPPLEDWELGEPDVVLQLPEVQTIAATGVEPYRHFSIENPFDHAVWIRAMDIKPGNHRVVHHVILFAKWPESPSTSGNLGMYFYGWAPGATPLVYPEGVAKHLPPHAKLTIEMHYTTTGTEESDLTEVALYLAEGPQARSGETLAAINTELDIPPGMDDARHSATYAFPKPATLYGLFPHMHFRGKWMRYELLLPNGKRETLLHIPRYDFQWQQTYYFRKPRHVPAGTWMLVTGAFDNSVSNPANPDPGKRVFWGDQSWEEMFIGFFEAADDPL